MNKLFRVLAPYIALAGGILFILLAVRGLQARKTYLNTTATITDIQVEYGASTEENEHRVLVKYTVDGTEYESLLGEYSSSMRIGQSVDILYDPDDPGTILSAGLLGPVLQLAVGAAAIAYFLADTFRKIRGAQES